MFTRRYKVHKLVWFQQFADVREAIQRQKTMKEWPRAWKVNLIERENLHWIDLYPSLPGIHTVAIGRASRWMDRGDKPRDDS
jgi:putative endonuclease